MRIDTLKLNNFRAIKEHSFSLNPRMNIFAGINGSGKTTILDACGLALSWFAAKLKNHNGQGSTIAVPYDINSESQDCSINITCTFEESIPCDWTLFRGRPNYPHSGKSNFTHLNEVTRSYQEKIADTRGKTPLPVLVYYRVNRVGLDIPSRIRTHHEFSSSSAYDDFYSGSTNFRKFFEWFREREELENEKLRDANDTPQTNSFVEDYQLHAVREAISHFMPSLSKLRIRRNPLRMEVLKSGRPLVIQQLSDGEKALISMVADIARLLALTNPDSANPLLGKGVVLIDEIELHLHPKWQRSILGTLMNVFPQCQFLISTHSPHVINHMSEGSLFLLDQNENSGLITVNETSCSSYGYPADSILTRFMGLNTTRPQEIEEQLKAIAILIHEENLDLAQKQLEDLELQIQDDADIERLKQVIRVRQLFK